MYTSLYGGLQTANTVPATLAQSTFSQYQDSGGFYPPLFPGSPQSSSQNMTGLRSFGSYSQPVSPSSHRGNAINNSSFSSADCTLSPLIGTGLESLSPGGAQNEISGPYQRQASSSNGQPIFFSLPQGLADIPMSADSVARSLSPAAIGGIVGSNFQPSGPPVSPGLCSICQDRATGKHYGANSCDGCKGFFRRTIRKNQKYSCRFNKNCEIDRDKRNTCRYCRFKKCIQAGMRRDAVQNERDRINSKKSPASLRLKYGMDAIKTEVDRMSPENSSESPDIGSEPMNISARSQDYIDQLLKAEAICSQLRATVITRTADQMPVPTRGTPMLASTPADGQNQTLKKEGEEREATVNDVTNSMHQQLLLMVEWAKTLSPFIELNIDDQVALLRNYAAQHLLICVAYRSRHGHDQLFLTNETCLPREPSAEIPDVNHVTVRVLDELVAPIKDISIEESEFVCLRAIVFFNPNAKGLSDQVGWVSDTRQSILLALNEYVVEKYPSDKCRFGNLLLLLPPLQAIAQNLIEDIQLASLFGMARIDSLLQELLLSEESGRSRIIELGGAGGNRQFLGDSFFQNVKSDQDKSVAESGPGRESYYSCEEQKINKSKCQC